MGTISGLRVEDAANVPPLLPSFIPTFIEHRSPLFRSEVSAMESLQFAQIIADLQTLQNAVSLLRSRVPVPTTHHLSSPHSDSETVRIPMQP